MRKHNRYNYPTFCEMIWPNITDQLFESMVEDFLIRLKLNRDVVEDLLGSNELRKLVEIQIPKILRNKTARNESNKISVWHIFVIGNWSVSNLKKAQKTSTGRISYDPSWEEQDYFSNGIIKEVWENSTK